MNANIIFGNNFHRIHDCTFIPWRHRNIPHFLENSCSNPIAQTSWCRVMFGFWGFGGNCVIDTLISLGAGKVLLGSLSFQEKAFPSPFLDLMKWGLYHMEGLNADMPCLSDTPTWWAAFMVSKQVTYQCFKTVLYSTYISLILRYHVGEIFTNRVYHFYG